MDISRVNTIIEQYRKDEESVYHTWFINNNERLKAFRTIKKGVGKVVSEIENRTFGNDFKGSSLETVVTAISEQKQIFEGAAHAFFWKPKLRIPDIYENAENQLAFGRFLNACLQAKNGEQIENAMIRLDQLHIKGLGPAVANIIYFLHPTLFPPFNTAIVRGFNALFHSKTKLGSWTAYLEMRAAVLAANKQFALSKDLGAVAGLFFEIGSGRLIIPENAGRFLEDEGKRRMRDFNKRHRQVLDDLSEETTHSEMQYYLAKLGKALGYSIWIAQNDHQREWRGKKLGEYSLPRLPLSGLPKKTFDTISLIDVIWLNQDREIVSGFEVEKSTSIYSGILRLYDLSLSLSNKSCRLFLVAPDKREQEIRAQLLRPSFQGTTSAMNYILFSDLKCDCDSMCKFGTDLTVLDPVSKTV
ncbi:MULTISPECIES: hypothetical protein [unclassified Sporolactobacillus]|uniref:hypothetical protein n=1 Tax=unclassified Sporolactobacillus TaxID=2628533 RepID=UPI002367D1E1|nr:hypothetical protein [Sporolactobacillus sp. CQH2019]MDD9148558.1 hypothetical protein [Sporolactobacillus sp. CQH2019]